jgi:pimeloyl-ACP methyl ester carboxylesterase
LDNRNAAFGAGREWAASLPNARLLTVPGAAHRAWVDAPELVPQALETFMLGAWPAEAGRSDGSPSG